MIIDADELYGKVVAEHEPGEPLDCPWPVCIRELTTSGALRRHMEKDHHALFRHEPPVEAPAELPAPTPEPDPEPAEPAPREETPMAPKLCALAGCDRPFGHSGRHRGQGGKKTNPEADTPSSPAERAAALGEAASELVEKLNGRTTLPVSITDEELEALEAIAFLAREDALVTVGRLLSDTIADYLEDDPLIQQIVDLRTSEEVSS